MVVVDTAHGHSRGVLMPSHDQATVKQHPGYRGKYRNAGRRQALIDAGADAIKIGIGPGSICTTRAVPALAFPSFRRCWSPLRPAAKATSPVLPTVASGFPATCQGGRRGRGLRDGRFFAGGHRGKPRRGFLYQGRSYKSYRGWVARCDGAGIRGPLFPAGSAGQLKLVPEGIEGRVPYKGPAGAVCISLSAVCARRWVIPATVPSPICNETALSAGHGSGLPRRTCP